MPNKVIAVCSVGDPLSPKTWSGVPANICRLLQGMGLLDDTLDSSQYAPRYMRGIANILSRLYYGSSFDTGRGRIERYMRARYVGAHFARSDAIDVLHTGTYDLPIPRSFYRGRHHLFCDSTWDLWSRGSTDMHLYSGRLFRDAERLEQASYQQMTHIFPISEYVRENLISHYGVAPERITVVGTGRGAIQPFTGVKDYSNGTILFVAKGRFEDKGGPLLVEGFKLALKDNSHLRLVIVGDSSYRERIGDVPNVEVHGFVPLEQLQGFFNEAALFAMPAVNEPWGLVYLEALSCKTPVMGLNRNSIPEITQRGRFGFCLSEVTPDEIAAALLEASRHPERLEQMGVEGQAYCLQNFTWERTVGRIIQTINEINS